jgi:disulfide bond formation protein DsbB
MTENPQASASDRTALDVVAAPLTTLDALLARYGLYLALTVAWTAMVGSLYFSEIRNFDPCVLCWYQRIALYPIALLLPIGILRRDPKVHVYVLALALVCIPMSIYNYLLQKTTWFDPHAVCRHGVPCSAMYINWFGFITIPFLALIAALLITLTTSAWARRQALLAPAAVESRRPWLPVIGTIAGVVAFYVVLYLVVG